MHKALNACKEFDTAMSASLEHANRVAVIDSLLNKYRDRLVLKDIEARLVGVECKSLNTNTSIAAEKVFDVAAAPPCVIAADVTVVCAEHGTAFTGALHNVNQRRIRSELGVGECISAPEVNIPFAVAVPFGARREVLTCFISFPESLPERA